MCSKVVLISLTPTDLASVKIAANLVIARKSTQCENIAQGVGDSRGVQGGFSQELFLRELKIPPVRTLRTFGRNRKYVPVRHEDRRAAAGALQK